LHSIVQLIALTQRLQMMADIITAYFHLLSSQRIYPIPI
jgi:hypothetical protein